MPAAAFRGGALRSCRAGTAGGAGEFDHDDFGAALHGGVPPGVALSFGAGDLPGVEVDGETRFVVAGAGAGLSGLVEQGRGDHGDAEGGGGGDGVGRGVAGVEVVLGG